MAFVMGASVASVSLKAGASQASLALRDRLLKPTTTTVCPERGVFGPCRPIQCAPSSTATPIVAMTPRAQRNLLALDAHDVARTAESGTTEGKGPSVGRTGSLGGSAAGPLTGA